MEIRRGRAWKCRRLEGEGDDNMHGFGTLVCISMLQLDPWLYPYGLHSSVQR